MDREITIHEGLKKLEESVNLKKEMIYKEFKDENEIYSPLPALEVLGFIESLFFKIDRTVQKGIKGLLDYIHTTNILIEDLVEYKTKTPNIKTLYKNRNRFLELKERKKFYQIENRKAPVIMGLKVRLIELVEILERNSHVINEVSVSLKEFEDYVDKLLNIEKGKLNLKDTKGEIKKLDRLSEVVDKDLASTTSDKILKDRMPIKYLVKNYNELDDAIKRTLKLGDVYKMEKLEDIHDLNDELVDRLDMLYTILKKKNVEVNKNDIEDFSNYIGAMAKGVTSVGFLYYLYYQVANMINAVIDIMAALDEDHTLIDTIAYNIKNIGNTFNRFLSGF